MRAAALLAGRAAFGVAECAVGPGKLRILRLVGRALLGPYPWNDRRGIRGRSLDGRGA